MGKVIFKGVVIGTVAFLALLGVGLLAFEPVFEFVLLFSFPVIHLVGPLFGLLTAESLDGPSGGVLILLISAWLEFNVIAVFVIVALTKWRSNPAFKRDALKRAP